MSAKHTPGPVVDDTETEAGPWVIAGDGSITRNLTFVGGGDAGHELLTGTYSPELTAALELLEALEELQRINDEDARGNRPKGRVAAWKAAREAIAKARGGQ